MSEPNYYKVVQTMEDGHPRLAAVPRSWETGGKLMWPPKSKQVKALKNPLLLPGTEDDGWQQYDCVVKRNFIPTYAEAINEIKIMSDHSDTSDMDGNQLFVFSTPSQVNPNSRKRRKTTRVVTNADDDRFNFNPAAVCVSPI